MAGVGRPGIVVTLAAAGAVLALVSVTANDEVTASDAGAFSDSGAEGCLICHNSPDLPAARVAFEKW